MLLPLSAHTARQSQDGGEERGREEKERDLDVVFTTMFMLACHFSTSIVLVMNISLTTTAVVCLIDYLKFCNFLRALAM